MPLHTTRREAAAARQGTTQQRSDRPRERRSAGGAPAAVTGTLSQVRLRTVAPAEQLRAAGDGGEDQLRFEGHASVYERGYEMWDWYGPYTEVVSHGAAAATLSRSPDVAFLLNHRGMILARTTSGTLRLREDDTGLFSEADLDPENSVVRDLASGMRRGDMTEMSFAFTITRGQWSPDYTEFRIDEFDLERGDVSAVNYGANPATTSTLRGALGSDDVVEALRSMSPDVAAATLQRAQEALRAPSPGRAGAMGTEELEAIRALVRPASARALAG